MSTQGMYLVSFVLGLIVGAGAAYSGAGPNRWGWGLVPLVAAGLFVLLLIGAVRL